MDINFRAWSVCGRHVSLGLALLALASCGGTPSATPSAGIATPTPVVSHSSATAGPATPIAFPQQLPPPSGRPLMAALLKGTLVLVGDCLRVTAPGGTNYPILWPADATLRADGNTIEIFAGGQFVARVGGPIALGGGELPVNQEISTPVRAALREAPPARCPGPYWFAHFITPTGVRMEPGAATGTPR